MEEGVTLSKGLDDVSSEKVYRALADSGGTGITPGCGRMRKRSRAVERNDVMCYVDLGKTLLSSYFGSRDAAMESP